MSIGAIATLTVFAVFALMITAYDLYVIKKRSKFDTISGFIIRTGRKFPAFTMLFGFTFGFLGGHLFWSMDTFDYEDPKALTERCKQHLEEYL